MKKYLTPICQRSDLPDLSDQLRIGYRVEGNSVVRFESRIRWDNKSEWLEHPVTQFRYVASIARWRLYRMFRDLKWRGYQPKPEAASQEDLVGEVEKDPTGSFGG